MSIETDYIELVKELLDAPEKRSRTTTSTRAVFARQLTHDCSEGLPVLTTKEVWTRGAVVELIWILNGRTDLYFLHEHGVRYWDNDYVRSGRTDMRLGPVYGKQWRNFNGVDQIAKLLNTLQSNPSSRRMLVQAWNPTEVDECALPPCHYGFQVQVQDGRLNLLWLQRSVDIFLGFPIDLAMYGILIEMLAKGAGLEAGTLTCQMGDVHLYDNHREAAKQQIGNKIHPFCRLELKKGLHSVGRSVQIPKVQDVSIHDYVSSGKIKATLPV